MYKLLLWSLLVSFYLAQLLFIVWIYISQLSRFCTFAGLTGVEIYSL